MPTTGASRSDSATAKTEEKSATTPSLIAGFGAQFETAVVPGFGDPLSVAAFGATAATSSTPVMQQATPNVATGVSVIGTTAIAAAGGAMETSLSPAGARGFLSFEPLGKRPKLLDDQFITCGGDQSGRPHSPHRPGDVEPI